MKKKLTLKTSSIGQTIKILEQLESIGVELDAEGRGKTITLTFYGEQESIKRAVRKLRQIATANKHL